ncbi:GIY-YIG nuclease family protein [Streptomyces sp. NPDC048219]|uniref:GIY-YIG nuclease family protein n=1 Tax=Streptomyces sp. NPDC048219 TaxID=3365517 RepID=UPI00371EC3FC
MVQREERTAVYRLYDASERLLYVGISRDPEVRWKQHARLKYWWPAVTSQTVEWCESRREAERAEAQAIARERPRYDESNRQGAGWNTPAPARDEQSALKACAVEALLCSIRDGTFPAWSLLPSRKALAERYGLPQAAVDSALWDLRAKPMKALSILSKYIVVTGPEEFPSGVHRRFGAVYALALLHFGDRPFTAQELVDSTRIGKTTVVSELRRWRDSGLADVHGEPRRGPGARFTLRVTEAADAGACATS